MLELGDFQIETVTIEIRHDTGLALWDRAGAIWSELKAEFPELQYQAVAPAQQVFESEQVRAMTELEAFRVICRGKEADVRVAEIGEKMLRVVANHLNLTVFKRIGYREIRSKKAPSNEEAFNAISYVLPKQSADRRPDSETRLIGGLLTLRQESKVDGLLATIRTEERDVSFSIPWDVRHMFPVNPYKQSLIMLDADYYTVGTTRRDGLSIGDWSKQASRAIKRFWKDTL